MRQDKIVELGQGLRTAFIIKSAEYPIPRRWRDECHYNDTQTDVKR